MGEPVYSVVWPLGKAVYEVLPLAGRARNLQGETICEVSDFRFRSEEVFPLLRETLARRYPGIRFVDGSIFGDTHGHKEREVIAALPGLLREHKCDAVISGVGA